MSKRKSNPILEMFNKKQKKEQNDEEELNISNVLQLNSDSPANNECNDIGVLLETKTIFTDIIREHLLTNPLIPHQNDPLPYSEHLKKGNIVKYYFQRFSWIIYSPFKKGIYCKFCTTFALNKHVGAYKCNSEAGYLVKYPFISFSKLIGKDGALIKHENTIYHKNAIEASKDFLKIYDRPELEIINRLDDHRLKQIKENRSRLLPIVDTIITMGKQNITFRGNRDDGKLLDEPENFSITNEGNFRAILRMRVRAGDGELKNHLQNSSQTATYISKTIQNELIDICRKIISNEILKQISDNKLYTIMFDEITEISHISQLSLVLRYLNKDSIREDFISFVDVHKVNLENLENYV